ncbi:hypothetical protein GUITHDRAFT_160438 [Guillardia theta CCMP2712]|uniref:Uncharacterized protein n=1 Tax=Guillardia theta (strain CCMP2712) TaxID=905079 RepID=L1K3G9_GUITC|nr:hypothetical protein GUITHDRAFT_160438 [Guillardia theta CCMP2712]EKX55341.1 hypothetical protein GUITHDRAFT_160438 [Guillardia theta CCMP2712]|eukprot:XP_005842321.1 hypothetical protein GUITHDRAFT_160438 [Guillardia theta CCMP2712]
MIFSPHAQQSPPECDLEEAAQRCAELVWMDRPCFECGLKVRSCLCRPPSESTGPRQLSVSQLYEQLSMKTYGTQLRLLQGAKDSASETPKERRRQGNHDELFQPSSEVGYPLQGKRMQVLIKAKRGLVDRGSRAAIQVVCSCLEHPEQYVRGAAVEALGKICERGDKEAIGIILPLLASEHDGTRDAAAEALSLVAARGDQDVISKVLAIAKSSQLLQCRVSAIKVIPRISLRGSSSVVESLIALGDVGHLELVLVIQEALVDLCLRGDRRAISLLSAQACSPEPRARIASILGLASIAELCKPGDGNAFQVLKKALQDCDKDVRAAAASAIFPLVPVGGNSKPWLSGSAATNLKLLCVEAKALIRKFGDDTSGPALKTQDEAIGSCCQTEHEREPYKGESFLSLSATGSSPASSTAGGDIPGDSSRAFKMRFQKFVDDAMREQTASAGASSEQVEEEISLLVLQMVLIVSTSVAVEDNARLIEEVDQKQKRLWSQQLKDLKASKSSKSSKLVLPKSSGRPMSMSMRSSARAADSASSGFAFGNLGLLLAGQQRDTDSSSSSFPSPCVMVDLRIDRRRLAELTLMQADTVKVEKNESRNRGSGEGRESLVMTGSQRKPVRQHTLSVEKFMSNFSISLELKKRARGGLIGNLSRSFASSTTQT